MYRKDTRNRLCELIIFLGEEEAELEQARVAVCSLPVFEPFSAFKRIDRLRQGCISASDIQAFLAQNNRFYDEIDCETFIFQYDIDADTKLSFIEFVKSLLPFDDEQLRADVTQRPHFDPQESLPYDIENALANLIEKEISINKKAEVMKVLLYKCSGFKGRDAFTRIDRLQEGEITLHSLQEFLQESGDGFQASSEQERTLAFAIHRLDRRSVGSLSLNDFLMAIHPLQITFDRSFHHDADRSFIDRNILLNSSYQSAAVNKSLLNESGYSTVGQSHNVSRVLSNNNNNNLDQSNYLLNDSAAQSVNNLSYSQTMNQLMNSSLLCDSNKQSSQQRNGSRNFCSGGASRVADASFRNVITESKMNSSFWNNSIQQHQPQNQQVSFTSSQSQQQQQQQGQQTRSKRSFSNIDADSIGRPKLIVKQEAYFKKRGVVGKQYAETQIFKEVKVLVAVFRQMIEFEREIELIKQDLAMCLDFNFQDAFRVFDPHDKGIVTQAEFQETLTHLSIYYSFDDVYLFFRKYDRDSDGRIRFSDFIDAIMPKQKEYSQMINSRPSRGKRGLNEYTKMFSKDTRACYQKLLDKHLQSLFVIEEMLHKLHNVDGSQQFDLGSLFEILDSDEDGSITLADIKKQIELQGFSTSEKELRYLVDRINASSTSEYRSDSSHISLQTFTKEFTPHLYRQ